MISSTSDRRAAARRKAWGRGPAVLRFDSLEARGLMAVSTAALPDLVAVQFTASGNYDWDQLVHVSGILANNGGGPTKVDSRADVYVSASPKIDINSVPIGSIAIPAGLGAGKSVTINQDVRLPPSAIPKVGSDGLIYLELRVDPANIVAEQNKINNEGQGQGIDTTAIYIVPQRSSNLKTTSFALSSKSVAWGGSVTVGAQINNNAAGSAPATRARVVLTPNGITPGTGFDFNIGDIQVPAVSPYSTVNVSKEVSLPPVIPAILSGYAKYDVSLVLDADYQANVMYPHTTTQGLGVDRAGITLTGGSTSPMVTTTDSAGVVSTVTGLPDLATAGVLAPTGPIAWGQSFQVSTSIQNLGRVDSGAFDVRFILTGPTGATSFAVNLGSVHVSGLKANFGQDIVATVRLPGRLPAGVNLSSGGSGRVVAIVDPESRVDELFHSNNTSYSNPTTLRVVGRDGNSTVPTQLRGNVPLTTITSTTTTPGTPIPAGTTSVHGKKSKANQGGGTPTTVALNPKVGPGTGSRDGTGHRSTKSKSNVGNQVTSGAKKFGNSIKNFLHI